jgi:hypothetical protein
MLIAVIILAAASFVTAGVNVDLSGEYWFGSMSADVSTNMPWVKRGTFIFTSNNMSQQWDDQDGHHTFSSTYTATLQADGSLNIELSTGTINVAWNGDVMIRAYTAPEDNRLGIDIIARKAENLTLNDVTGDYTFFGHQINSVDGDDSAEWGNIVFKTNGTAAYNYANDHGRTESGSLSWTLDAISAMLSIPGQTSQNGILLGKGGIGLTFQVLPSEGRDDDLGYNVFIKKTTQTITPADIAGTYNVRFLETGPGGVPYTCGQGTVTINANGTYDVDAHYSDGEDDTHHGNFSVGPGNKIRFDGAIDGIISPDKNLIFAPETDRPSNPADYDWIGGLFFVKASNSTPVLQFGNVSSTKNQKLTITDPCGVLVTFSLSGGGYGELANGNDFSEIDLYDTTDTSQLTITTKGGPSTNIGSITCNGPMKSITAKTATINGDITINGTSSDPKAAVAITFDESTNLDISSLMPIKSIAASDWLGTLTAPSVGSITAKSNPKLDRWGYVYIDANVTGAISNIKTVYLGGEWTCKSAASITSNRTDSFYLTLAQEPNVKVPALGKLTVAGNFANSRIIAAGNIGTVSVGKMQSSSCFAGVADACLIDVDANDGVLDLPPVLDDTFSQDATIKSITIKGVKGLAPPYFINSNIAAANILSVSIAYPEYNNSGMPFGITMWNNPNVLKTLKIKDDEGTHSWKGIDIGEAVSWLSGLGYDMQIRRD